MENPVSDNTRSTNSYFSSTTHALVTSFIFVLMSMIAFAVRDAEILLMISRGEIITNSEYGMRAEVCRSMSVCLRVFDAWMGVAMEWIMIEGSRAIDLLPNRVIPEQLSLAVKEGYLIIMAGIMTRTLGMAPMIVGAFIAYRNLTLRLLFILAAFMSIYGWARSNPLFSEMGMGQMDYTAIGFVCLLFVMMVKGHTRSFAKSAVLLVIGQMILENLGILTGVAIVFHNFMTDRASADVTDHWRKAFRHLAGYAAVSVVAVVVVYYLRVSEEAGQLYGEVGFVSYFKTFWEDWGRVNFQEFHDIRENYFDMMAYPVAAGIILGLLSALVFRGEDKSVSAIGHQFWAAIGLWIGFMCTLVVAMFVSGLYYEMGRQLLPLSVITTIAWAKGIELLAVRLMQRTVVETPTT